MRTAHYVASTHWDREWYEPFQGYRMRLVSLLDEAFAVMQRDPAFKTFVMDGQFIPIADYLEARPEAEQTVREFVRTGRLKLGPWYVLPDEWIPCGESLVRNLQMGMKYSASLGAPASRAGAVCDQFGHTSQLPQIFSQLGVKVAFAWRGLSEETNPGHSLWIAPDGTALPTYRYGLGGYCHYAFDVRNARFPDETLDVPAAVDRLIAFVQRESARTPKGPLLLFDGADHLEIEPATSQMIALANERLAAEGIRIVHSDLDAYADDFINSKVKIDKTLHGELRETADQRETVEQPWVIPGVLSSRIHLKQKNAACEDELCLWAEPFTTFASRLGLEYPTRYLELSWKHLLDNHPHDSLCGCSIDQVHQDMIYRFDQSIGISSRLTDKALRAIGSAALPETLPPNAVPLALFNPTSEAVDEPVDIDIPLPTDWPTKFQEFFQYEEKFAFQIAAPDGKIIPYQLVGQQRDQAGYRRPRYKFPATDRRHLIHVTARVRVPAFGYTTLLVTPVEGPTRFSGSMATSHRSVENEFLKISVNASGTIDLTDKRSGRTFSGLLAFEQRADIGDGWFHGLAVNDQIFSSIGAPAEVSLIADGIGKATLRIAVSIQVPEEFDFRLMRRSERMATLRVVSDVTLRAGVDHVEVETTVHNTVKDHRLRVLFPTELPGDVYWSDAAFDVVERMIALRPDHDQRREWEQETRPQITWTAFGGDKAGLAIVSRGLPECTVRDTPERPIALTLLRAFRRAVMSNDNPGGQIQGDQKFSYRIVPFSGELPIKKLFVLGQRINGRMRSINLLRDRPAPAGTLPATASFFQIVGDVVVTSIQKESNGATVRLFNPHLKNQPVQFSNGVTIRQLARLGGDADTLLAKITGNQLVIPPKRIVTVLLNLSDVATDALRES